ncbi:MAG: hypothetical protein HRU75_08850 [Planctomycetia bacterium]|nr:MAG: hypothetical protein HRU75_08850 [Planctomycetia bacterium]
MLRYLLIASAVASASLPSASAVAAERDPLTMLPPDALVVVEWRGLSADGGLIRTLSAAAQAPLLRDIMGMDAEEITAAVSVMERVIRHPGALGFYVKDDVPGLIAVVDAGADAERMVEKNLSLGSGADPDANPVSIGGLDWRYFDADSGTPRFTAHDGRFVFATSDQRALAAARTLTTGGAKNVAATPGLVAASAAAKHEAGWRLSAWVDLKSLLQLARDDDEKFGELLTAVGADGAEWLYLRMDESPHGDRIHVRVQAPNLDHVMRALYSDAAVTDADLACIPADAYWGYSFTLDLRRVFDQVMSVVEAMDEEAHQSAADGLTLVGQFLGFGVTDLLDCFGDNWTLYDSPAHGGVLFTGAVVVAEVKDGAALHGILSRLVQISGAAVGSLTSSVRIAQREYSADGQTVNYVAVSGAPMPIAPSWAIIGDRCVFALFPQTAAAALRQVDPASRKGSLPDVAEYKRLRPLLGEKLTALWYVNGREQSRATYGIWQIVATAVANMAGGADGAMTIEQIPTFPQRQAAVRSTLGGYRVDANGMTYLAYGDSAMGMILEGGTLSNTALLASILVPSFSQARESARTAVSASNLRMIGMACHIYANEHQEKFPPDFDALVADGRLAREQLVSPRDPRGSPDRSSYVYVPGQSAASDPRNVLAYEPAYDGDRAVVLFVDAHVEVVSPERLEDELERTQERLKRAAAGR